MKRHTLFLIKPAQLHKGQPLRFERVLTPTRALPYLAALTPPDFEVKLFDDSVEEIDFTAPVDVVGISALIMQVPRAIEIANRFRARGVPVIMGGVGSSSVPDVVRPHADSLVLGEADALWADVLEDFRQGRLQPEYRADSWFDMQGMPAPRFDLLPRTGYMRTPRAASADGFMRVPVETARGCPHNCAFCYVSRYFGRSPRFRPIGEVVAEVRRFRGAYVFFVDDNIAVQPARAKALFKALRPLGIRWVGQFSVMAARDPELLELAAASGCMNAFIGLESIAEESLATVGKSFSLSRSVSDTLAAFRRAGIEPHVSIVFGFDHDTLDSMERTLQVMIEQRVHLLYPFILTPLPGTAWHDQLEREGRILHRDYSLYDATHVVFRPARMRPDELQAKYWEIARRFYACPSILRRFCNLPLLMARGRAKASLHNLAGNWFFGRMLARGHHPLAGGLPKRGTQSRA